MTTAPPKPAQSDAQRVTLLKTLQEIHAHRPYLDLKALEDRVLACTASSNHDAQWWAEHTLLLIRNEKPLPWEQN